MYLENFLDFSEGLVIPQSQSLSVPADEIHSCQ